MKEQKITSEDVLSFRSKCLEIKTFLDGKTPRLRAFAAGQLLGLYERLMDDITDEEPSHEAESCKEEKCDAFLLLGLYEDFESIPIESREKKFAEGKFVPREGKEGFKSFRVKSSTIHRSSEYMRFGRGYQLAIQIQVNNYPVEVENGMRKFLDKNVIALYHKDDNDYFEGYFSNYEESTLTSDTTDMENIFFTLRAAPTSKEVILLNQENF